jgi:hypothetical protein
MTACLVLVDVENWLDVKDGQWSWVPPAGEFKKRCSCRIDTARAVLAVGTSMAKKPLFSRRENLERIAKGSILALGLNGVPLVFEVVLALSAPEAADRALLLASLAAPDSAGCGPFGHVALLSGDFGLREALVRSLKLPHWPKSRGRRSNVFLWCRHEKPIQRTEPPRSVHPSASLTPVASGPTVFVETDELAVWAATQAVQVRGQLADVADQVDKNPALLTQVGVTALSGGSPVARGVARIEQVLATGPEATPPLLGSCTAKDGLEVAIPDQTLDTSAVVNKVCISPLGPGAVRLYLDEGKGSATVRTCLPLFVVKTIERIRVSKVAPSGKLRLREDRVLAHAADFPAGLDMKSCVARFIKVNGIRGSFCEIDQPQRDPLSWWYWRGKASAKVRITDGILLPETNVKVTCRPRILDNPENQLHNLVWQIVPEALIPGAGMAAGHAIEAGKIGVATWTNSKGQTRQALVLALGAIGAGQIDGGRAVQDVPWSAVREKVQSLLPGVKGRDWHDIQLLPLVVAGGNRAV